MLKQKLTKAILDALFDLTVHDAEVQDASSADYFAALTEVADEIKVYAEVRGAGLAAPGGQP